MLYVDQSYCYSQLVFSRSFFFNDTATTEIYTLSLHDALPISSGEPRPSSRPSTTPTRCAGWTVGDVAAHDIGSMVDVVEGRDRKSTRLNSSHSSISYAVFCLKKKKPNQTRNFCLHV